MIHSFVLIFLNKHLASVYHVLSIWYGCTDILVNRTNVKSEQNMKAVSNFQRPWIYQKAVFEMFPHSHCMLHKL